MLTVFLSSVAHELEAFRDAAYTAIEGLENCHCVRMEDFGARNNTPQNLCRQKVEECGLFVGLLGSRYGSQPPDSSDSYTAIEIETAISADKPRFFFLTSEDFPMPEGPPEDSEAAERQTLLRDRVMIDRQVAFFGDNPEELARLIVQALYNHQQVESRVDVVKSTHPSDEEVLSNILDHITQTYIVKEAAKAVDYGGQKAIVCVVSAAAVGVRGEGISERVGTLSLEVFPIGEHQDTGQTLVVDIAISLNVFITNSLTNHQADAWVETDYGGARTEPRVRIAGVLKAANRVVFERVPLTISGIDRSTRIHVQNLRANATQLNTRSPETVREILAFVSIEPTHRGTPPPRVINDLSTVAWIYPQTSVTIETITLDSISPNSSRWRDIVPSSWNDVLPLFAVSLSFKESFPASFTARSQENTPPHRAPVTMGYGTRFLTRLFDVPENVLVFASIVDVPAGGFRHAQIGDSTKALLVHECDGNAAGGNLTTPETLRNQHLVVFEGFPFIRLRLCGGLAIAAWEWRHVANTSPGVCGSASFALIFAHVGERSAEPKVAKITACLAPASTVMMASRQSPTPRFLDLSDYKHQIPIWSLPRTP